MFKLTVFTFSFSLGSSYFQSSNIDSKNPSLYALGNLIIKDIIAPSNANVIIQAIHPLKAIFISKVLYTKDITDTIKADVR